MSRNRLLLTLACLSVISACNSEPPPQAPAAPAKKAAVVKPVQSRISSAAPSTLLPVVSFMNRRDPFKSLVSAQPKIAVAPASGSPEKTSADMSAIPIRRYDTEQYTLLGIVTGVEGNRALVIDPDNKSHVVRHGQYIGRNRGTVVKIESRAIVVSEPVTTDSGKKRTRTVRVELPKR